MTTIITATSQKNSRSFRARPLAASIAFALALGGASTIAHAHTATVSTVAQLKAAITAAEADMANDTITLMGNITFASAVDAITISGTGSSGTITIQGGGFTLSGFNLARVLDVQSGTVVINNLTITNGFLTGNGGNTPGNAVALPGGSSLGAGIRNAGTLTITNSTITANKAAGGGGGGGGAGGGSGAGGGGGGFGTAFGGAGGTNPTHTAGAASAGTGGTGAGFSGGGIMGGRGGSGGTGVGAAGAGGAYGGYTNGGNGGLANNGTIRIGGGGGGAGYAYGGGAGGNASAGIHNTGTLTITGSAITNNIAAGGGGGGGAAPGSASSGHGGTGGSGVGGIWNAGGTVNLDASTNTSLSTGNTGAAGAGGIASKPGSMSGPAGAATTTISTTGGGSTNTNFTPPPTITSATYNASTGTMNITAVNMVTGDTIDVSKLSVTGQGGNYPLTSGIVNASSATAFSVTLNAVDRAGVNGVLNQNGTSAVDTTTFNLSAAANWDVDTASAADLTDNAITVSSVSAPTITSATFDGATNVFVVTGTNLVKTIGATNDITISALTITGEGGATRTLSTTGNVEITSATSFAFTLAGADIAAVNALLNKNGSTSAGANTYNLAAADDWNSVITDGNIADLTSNGISVNNAKPSIQSATYDAGTGILSVTMINSVGGDTIDVSRLSITGQAGSYTLTSAVVTATSSTAFSVSLNPADKRVVNGLLNNNGTIAVDSTTFNLGAAANWNQTRTSSADLTGNAIIVSNVAAPAITSATFDASSNVLTVTGTNLVKTIGATNDVTVSALTITGEGGATRTLSTTGNVEIASAASFSITLAGADIDGVQALFNKDGSSSTSGTTYNLAAADNWNSVITGGNIQDLTGNGITVSNVPVPTITSATYDANAGMLVVTGTSLTTRSGANNDVDISKLTIVGDSTAYQLTSASVEITSATSFAVTLNATDKAALTTRINKNGTSSVGTIPYRLAAAEDWAAGTDLAIVVADLVGNGITASNVPNAQNITFTNPGAQNFGTSPTLTASASSGLTPIFTSSTTGVCTITSGGALTFVTPGSCTINANQAGNASFAAAPQVSRSFTVNAVAPGAPTIGTATAGNAQATVSFTPSAINSGSAITTYTATSNPPSFTGTCAAPCTSINVTGLANGTPYAFTVTATNGVGVGAASGTSNSVTPATVPGAPIIGTAAAGNTQATVAFTAPGSNGGSAIIDYTATCGAQTATAAASPIIVTGLANGTPVNCSVTARNAVGSGAASSASNSVTPQVPPAISLPASITGTVATGSTTPINFNIGNTGSGGLNYSVVSQTPLNVVNTTFNAGTGFRNTTYTDPVTAVNNAQYAADDFTLTQTLQLKSLYVEGFTLNGVTLASKFTDITWSIYPDASGLPAGNPLTNPSAVVWTYSALPTATGVSLVDGATASITLDLAAAGQTVSLPAARYWLVVSAKSNFANRWLHGQTTTSNGSDGIAFISIDTSNVGAWAANSTVGLAMRVTGTNACGATWMGTVAPASGSLIPAATQATSFTADASALVPGVYNGNVCIDSNDPALPNAVVPTQLTVSALPPQTITFGALAGKSFGDAAFTVSATGGASGNAVTFASQTTAVCTTTGTNGSTVTIVTVGTCTIRASQAGNASYTAAPNVDQSFTVAQGNQTTLVAVSTPSTVNFGGTTTLSSTGGLGIGAVTFASSNANCTIAGNTLTAAAAGTCIVTATKAADTNYTIATSAGITVTINQVAQATLVAVSTPSTVNFGGTTTLSSTGGSGTGTVTFASSNANCTIVGTTLTAAAAGTCTVTATKAADTNYTVATSVGITVTINQATQAALVAVSTPSTVGFAGTTSLSSTGGSGTGAVTFASNNANCTIAGTTLTAAAIGTCTVTATKAADTNFTAVTSPGITVTINQATQATLTAASTTLTVGFGGTSTLSTTGGSGTGAVTFASNNASCAIAGNILTANAATGTCDITATKLTDTNYLQAVSGNLLTITLAVATQTITFNPINSRFLNEGNFTVAATGGASPNPVTFASQTPLICTTSGTNGVAITVLRVGLCTIRANQAGNASYSAATLVDRSLNIVENLPKVTVSIAPGSEGLGTITQLGLTELRLNTVLNLTVAANPRYVTRMSGTCGGSITSSVALVPQGAGSNNYRTDSIGADCSIIASFIAVKPTITVSGSATPTATGATPAQTFSVLGAPATFTANLSGAIGALNLYNTSPTPVFIAFAADGVNIAGCEQQPITRTFVADETITRATCTTTNLSLGAKIITAAFSGDNYNFAAITSTVPTASSSVQALRHVIIAAGAPPPPVVLPPVFVPPGGVIVPPVMVPPGSTTTPNVPVSLPPITLTLRPMTAPAALPQTTSNPTAANGTVSPNGMDGTNGAGGVLEVPQNATVDLAITANPRYLAQVSGTCGGRVITSTSLVPQGAGSNIYRTAEVGGECTVVINFVAALPTITVSGTNAITPVNATPSISTSEVDKPATFTATMRQAVGVVGLNKTSPSTVFISFYADDIIIAGCEQQLLTLAFGLDDSYYQASCNTQALGVGQHKITVSFSGDKYNFPAITDANKTPTPALTHIVR